MSKNKTAPKTSKKIAAIKQPTDAQVLAHIERKRADEAAKAAAAPSSKVKAKVEKDAAKAQKAAEKLLKVETVVAEKPFVHDERVLAIYPIGTEIVKDYKRRDRKDSMIVQIKVVADGFVFNEKHFTSLSAIGNVLTGWNSTDGMRFFGFTKRAPKPKAAKSK